VIQIGGSGPDWRDDAVPEQWNTESGHLEAMTAPVRKTKERKRRLPKSRARAAGDRTFDESEFGELMQILPWVLT
jgi:hypothetical protein